MNQNQAPIGTVATIGHPANRCLIAKGNEGWRYLDTGKLVDPEMFRAGWKIVSLPGRCYEPSGC
jgi:hypothetical protein